MTLKAVEFPAKVLHLTYWDVEEEEVAHLAGLIA